MNNFYIKKNSTDITIKDIAKMGNVSIATVSRALTNKGVVAPKTKENILKIAKEYNYKPNIVFSVMGSRQHRNPQNMKNIPIALLYGEESQNRQLFKNLKSEYVPKAGFCLETIFVSASTSVGKIQNKLANLGIEGVILYSVASSIIKNIDLSSYSVISIHRGYYDNSYFNYIRPDFFNHIILAWKKAMEYGHSRIGVALGTQTVSSHDDRLRHGAVAECQHLWHDKLEIIPTYMGPVADQKQFMEWYNNYKPSCIIGVQVNYYWMLKKAGISIPNDVSFITLIKDPNDKNIDGICRADSETMQVAISQLDLLIRTKTKGIPPYPLSIYVRSIWADGKTLRHLK